MKLMLERFCYSEFGTFGSLIIPNGPTLKTVERPWVDNKPSISCIPVGTYTCKPRPFYRGGYDAYEITDVPGRTHILFHRANRWSDVEGCVGVGSKIGSVNNEWAVLDSKNAFDEFMRIMSGNQFVLTIRNTNDQGYLFG